MHKDLAYLRHILDSISKIRQYKEGKSKTDFFRSTLVQDAIIRQIEIIGEAAKNISPDIKNKDKSIPWKDIIGMRDKLIHGYFGVDLNAVWDTIERDIPDLEKKTKPLLGE